MFGGTCSEQGGNPSLLWIRPGWVGLLAACLVALTCARAQALAAQGVADNKVANGTFESFEGPSIDQKVATGWDAFVLSGKVGFYSGRNLFSSPERIDGQDSQVLKSDGPFEAGIYQIVSGLQKDQWYSVLVFVLSVFETSALTDPTVHDGIVLKQVGVDPEGGRNPSSSAIIWAPGSDKNMDRNTWGQRLTFQAKQNTATLFVRVRCNRSVSNPESQDVVVFIDGAQMRLAPVAQVSVPSQIQTGPFVISWSALVPGALQSEASIIEYDVQYRDGQGEWQNWLAHARTSAATFDRGLPGHTYTFRARAWARYANPFAEIFGPWAESAPVRLGRAIEVTALDNRGAPVLGVSTRLLGRSGEVLATTVTDSAGRAYLVPPSDDADYTVEVVPSWYLPPPPVYGIRVSTDVYPVAFTLRPPDDAIPDGSFEATELGRPPSGWQTVGEGVTITNFYFHCGRRALELRTTATSARACIRRELELRGSFQPVLSFWYRLRPDQDGMQSKELVAQAFGANYALLGAASFQASQETPWQEAHLVLAHSDEPFDGQVAVEFCLQDRPGWEPSSETAYAYLDDLSLGRSSGGPNRVHLPFALAGHPE